MSDEQLADLVEAIRLLAEATYNHRHGRRFPDRHFEVLRDRIRKRGFVPDPVGVASRPPTSRHTDPSTVTWPSVPPSCNPAPNPFVAHAAALRDQAQRDDPFAAHPWIKEEWKEAVRPWLEKGYDITSRSGVAAVGDIDLWVDFVKYVRLRPKVKP